MNKDRSFARLDQALKVWEDLCFLSRLEFAVKLSPGKPRYEKENFLGPLRHCDDFRTHIIQKAAEGDYDYERFTGSFEMESQILMETGRIPPSIFSWNHNSRRKFYLPSSYQALFSATSLDQYTWQDVRWPFKSFGLMLEDPIKDRDGNEFDCILVSEIAGVIKGWEGLEVFQFHLLSSKLDEYRPQKRDQLIKMARKRRWDSDKIRKRIAHLGNDFMKSFHVTTIGFDGKNKESLSRPSGEVFREYQQYLDGLELIDGQCKEIDEYEDLSIYDKAKHLVLCTCLFLQTISSKQALAIDNPSQGSKQTEPEPDQTLVRSNDGIFTISYSWNLSKEACDLASEIRKGRQQGYRRVHWRRGHFRKPWGKKGDECAESIWILPCLVNKHRLLANSIPASSETVFK